MDWLDANKLAYTFHDFKKEPATLEKLQEWGERVGWEPLVNRKGTTWRKLSPEQQADVVDGSSAYQILLAHNSMIKRPVIENAADIILGFNEETYQSTLLP